MTAPAHRTGTGHLPEASAVSWSCTCGDGQVFTYGLSVDESWALRLVHARASAHRTLTGLREAL